MKKLLRDIKENNILLEVVDGELKVFTDGETVEQELLTEIKINRSALIRLLQGNGEAFDDNSDKASLPLAQPAPAYPLSSSQHRLWVLSQFEAGNIGYSIPGVCVMEGSFNAKAFSDAFTALMDRHEVLRTVFREDEQGEVRQFILSTEEIGFEVLCEDRRGEMDTEQAIKQWVQAAFQQPFDLATGPLLRAGIFQVADHKWVFYYVMHHIISDGWSKKILVKELLQLYHAFCNGVSAPLQPLRIQYKDYAVWQQLQLDSADMQNQRAWWLQQFEGDIPLLDLPSDKVRPPLKTYNGAIHNKWINHQYIKQLRKCCQREGSTLFMGILATVNALLYRYTAQQDIIIGTPVAGRDHIDLEDQIGLYANTLALRTRFEGTHSFRELLRNIREVTTTAWEYQLYPFDKLVGDLGLQRDMGRNPLFDIQVIVQNPDFQVSAPAQQAGKKNKSAFTVDNFDGAEKQTSVFDLVFNFIDHHNGCELRMIYNTDVYSSALIEQLAVHVEQLLQAIVANPDTSINSLDFLSVPEKKQQIFGYNHKVLPLPAHKTILHYLEEQVARTPGALAIVYGDTRLSYRELWQKASSLANWLRKHHAVQPDDLVAIMLPRSESMIIAILGVLRAGAAWLPIDPEYPKTRKKLMLQDAAVKLLITQAGYIFDLDYYGGEVFAMDVQSTESADAGLLPAIDIQPQHLAYVIYTSGSTGEPNGVMIEHATLANSILVQQEIVKIREGETCLQFLSCSFDASVFEIFIALVNGAALHIIPEEHKKDLVLLEKFMNQHSIQFAVLPPALFNQLTIHNLPLLQRVMTGGEAPGITQANLFLQQGDYFNAYGPTEATIAASLYHCPKGQSLTGRSMPIGAPIANLHVYLLDKNRQLLPLGVPGEMYIAGAGVARGYLNRPELTARKFLPDPFRKGQTMYKTGDLGRWLPGGLLEFAGRKDNQVKMRGFRVEPGEIENIVQQYPGLEAACVLAIPNKQGEYELIAYLHSREPLDITALRSWLTGSLPAYMMPHHFLPLADWPLNANGKLDRKKLPLPEQAGIGAGIALAPPRNTLEKNMVAIWENILAKGEIGIRHNFFELGGDSIKILRLTAAIRKELKIEVAITDIYKYNTIETLMDQAIQPVEKVQEHQQAKEKERLIREELETLQDRILATLPTAVKEQIEAVYPMSDIEKGMVYESVMAPHSGIYHDQMVQHKVFVDFNLNRFRQAIHLMIQKHPILRTAFNIGDYDTEVQFVYKQIDVSVPYTELAGMERSEQEALIRAFMVQERATPFRFDQAPLWRMHIFQLGNDEYVFLFQTHHAIIDGWSDASFRTELNNIYLALEEEPDYRPALLASDYKDFVVQQMAIMADNRQHQFWQQELRGVTRLDLFTTTSILDKHAQAIPPALLAQVAYTAKRLNTTVKNVAIAAWYYLLSILGHSEEVVAGLVSNNRPDTEDGDKILGCFLNTIPCKIKVDNTATVSGFINSVDQQLRVLKMYDRLSMAAIARRQYKGAGQSNPFFDMVFNYVDFHTYRSVKEQQPAASAVPVAKPTPLQVGGYGRTNTFLDLTINTTGGGFNIGLKLTRELKAGLSAARIAGLYQRILTALSGNPQQRVGTIPLVDTTEKELLLEGFNQTAVSFPGNSTITSLFETRVAAQPQQIALIDGERIISYQQLNEAANCFAWYLKARNIGAPDELVAVVLSPGANRMTAILGILKTGAAFLPIDPQYPAERIEFMQRDSACKLLVDEALWASFIERAAQYPSTDLPDTATANHLAYVIYTSGSTGMPKGVMITHGALVNLCYWHNTRFNITPADKATLYAGPGFDAAVWEFFPYIIAGAAVYQVPEAIRYSINDLAHLYNQQGITISFLPTQVAEQFLEKENHSLRFLLTGGDKLKSFYPTSYQLVNNYGPTENTVVATSGLITAAHSNIPIGTPISNTQVLILNQQGNLLPAGVPGELCIAGKSLAQGYLHQPDLTLQRFVPHPFNAGERIYRTGDLGRWLSDGQIAFLGRIDNQVKIRGHRVEPKEIETALQQDALIDSAAVVTIAGAGGENELIAFIVSGQQADIPALKARLTLSLPAYMLPHRFIQLDQLPLTPNGKIDTAQLLEQASAATTDIRSYIPPRNETETALAALFCELLDKEQVSILDDFFESGGHSLLAMRMITRINKQLGVTLAIKDLYSFPSVAALAAFMEKPQAFTTLASTPVDLEKESFTGISYQHIHQLPSYRSEPQHIFLTGATGFIGSYLLRELLQLTGATIHCLVRAGDEVAGKARIQTTLEHYALYDHAWDKRITAIPGDLALPGLGISKDQYEFLTNQVDIVYHIAAHIDLMAPYEKLRPANVGSAIEMIKLATTARLKKIIYASTLSVFNSKQVAYRQESDLVDGEKHQQAAGYSASKWVAEKILHTALTNGVPVQVHRLGLITGDAITGKMPADQWFPQLLKLCMEAGSYPEGYGVPVTPVDFVARAIAKLSGGGPGIFHLAGEEDIPMEAFFTQRTALSKPVEKLPLGKWLNTIRQLPAGEWSKLVALLSFTFQLDPEADYSAVSAMPQKKNKIATAATLQALANLGCAFPDLSPYTRSYFLNLV